MLELVAGICLLGAVILLFALSKIDLDQGILPDELVLALLVAGLGFHLCTGFTYMPAIEMLLGAGAGAGLLYVIRLIANHFHGDDTLGLGDVKLMGAAGVWLGSYYVLPALILGASAGLLHGLGLAVAHRAKKGKFPDFRKLSLPAGPGFAIGIVLAALPMLENFPARLLMAVSP